MLLFHGNISYSGSDVQVNVFFEKLHKLSVFAQANPVMCYVSTQKEANTIELINEILACNKKVAVPKVGSDFSMDFYLISDLCELSTGKYGLQEPMGKSDTLYTIPCERSPQNPQLIIVPGVEFDVNKNRKGHGCGYYDRYFHRYGAHNFYKIGLAKDCQIKDAIEVRPHDVAMDLIITESGRII